MSGDCTPDYVTQAINIIGASALVLIVCVFTLLATIVL